MSCLPLGPCRRLEPAVPCKVTLEGICRLQKIQGWELGANELRRQVEPGRVTVPPPAAYAALRAFWMADLSSVTPLHFAPTRDADCYSRKNGVCVKADNYAK